jgi:hypothetical protein
MRFTIFIRIFVPIMCQEDRDLGAGNPEMNQKEKPLMELTFWECVWEQGLR